MNPNNEDELFAQLQQHAPLPPTVEVSQRIREGVIGDLSPQTSLDRRQRTLLCTALVLALGGGMVMLRWHQAEHPQRVNILLGSLAWAGALLFVLVLGVGPQSASRGPLRRSLAVGVPLLLFGYLAGCSTSWLSLGGFLADSGQRFMALRCGAMALGIGAACSASVLYVWRRSDPFSPQLSGTLAGLVGGLAGTITIGLVCPGEEGWHLWLGHGLGVLVLGLVGGLLGRRVLAP
jgi:hypothetical protein